MFEIAAGVLLAFAIRHIAKTALRLLWDEYAYPETGFFRGHPRQFLGRWDEGDKLPIPARFLRRLFEERWL